MTSVWTLLLLATQPLAVPEGLARWLEPSLALVDAWSPPQRGARVTAVGNGVVDAVDGGTVVVAHTFFENGERRTVHFIARNLSRVEAVPGQVVRRGDVLGQGARAISEVDGQTWAHFFRAREAPLNPLALPRAFVADLDSRRLFELEQGIPIRAWDIAIGQVEGAKEQRGDLKTPRGMYQVVSRYHGDIQGEWSAFYGRYWVKLNYPNSYDAARGLDAGWVSLEQAAAIGKAWRRGQLTAQDTRLGGGIGFHSWASSWDAGAGTQLSFGCVVLHPEEVDAFYARIQVGDWVVLR